MMGSNFTRMICPYFHTHQHCICYAKERTEHRSSIELEEVLLDRGKGAGKSNTLCVVVWHSLPTSADLVLRLPERKVCVFDYW